VPARHRPVLELARAAYLGTADDTEYDLRAVRASVAHVTQEIQRLAARRLE
jgi:hypothetical protein